MALKVTTSAFPTPPSQPKLCEALRAPRQLERARSRTARTPHRLRPVRAGPPGRTWWPRCPPCRPLPARAGAPAPPARKTSPPTGAGPTAPRAPASATASGAAVVAPAARPTAPRRPTACAAARARARRSTAAASRARARAATPPPTSRAPAFDSLGEALAISAHPAGWLHQAVWCRH